MDDIASGAQHAREWDSHAYHRVSEPQFAWGEKLIAELQLSGSETVLDAGCGSGRLTAELLKRLPHGHVIAVDQSANMIACARELLEQQFPNRATYMQTDLCELSLDNGCDGVFSAATFHWVRERDKMFQRLFAALRPGGWIVAQAGGLGSLNEFWSIADEVMSRAPYSVALFGFQRQQGYLDPEVTTEQMRATGFTEISTSLHEAPVSFPDRGSFIQFISTVNLKNHVHNLPQLLRESLLNDIAEAAHQSSTPLTLDYRRINIKAHRPC